VQPDYAFHLAGVSAASNTALFFTVNTEYAVTLLTALDRVGATIALFSWLALQQSMVLYRLATFR
jgi:hypothetical protein